MEKMLASQSFGTEGIFAMEVKEEPLSSVAPELCEQLIKLSPEEALKELNEEVKRRREEKKKPVYLTDEEKNLTPDQLYLKLKTDSITARESEFLQQLQLLPADYQSWSLADIKRWFRDARHRQWAIRQLKQNKQLFICPTCGKARDVQSHTCTPLWSRPTTRAGVPVQQQTYITKTPQGFRVGQHTVLDSD